MTDLARRMVDAAECALDLHAAHTEHEGGPNWRPESRAALTAGLGVLSREPGMGWLVAVIDDVEGTT